MTRLLVSFLICLLLTSASHASLYCTKPSKPYCIASYGRFNDDFDFQSCRSDMERYKSGIERYIQCVIDEAEQNTAEARQEYSRAVESFNARARSAY